jgi:tryptophanyl-tRNA synthetase
MAAPETTAELPLREGEKKGSTEQEINPWDVQAGQDEQGNMLQFDYVAISQYVLLPHPPTIQFNC